MASYIAGLIKQFMRVAGLAVLYSSVYAADSQMEAHQPLSELRRAELKNLLLQDCGSCHGMTMKGGLGPALTPDVLSNKSRQMVTITIMEGRPGTPMPPWKTILSEQEINWLVDTLYSGVTP